MISDEDALAALTRRMEELGAPGPGSWAGSEVSEGIAQQARYLVLRRIWAKALVPWRDPGVLRRNEALAQLIERGADQDVLAEALRDHFRGRRASYLPDAVSQDVRWTMKGVPHADHQSG